MKVVADLHLHSKYSRAVSQQMVPQIMAQWAAKKGIDLLATGDWTHPLWLKELESILEETQEGVFKAKNSLRSSQPQIKHFSEPNFVLSTEIASIYSQDGRARRIHNLVLAPSFSTVHKINEELKRRGCNLLSDGRPIIGLSSINLAELVWSIDDKVILIPAHCWTPWFAMYGSKSGFDSVEECWGKYSDRIYSVETGLSSDPLMNWRINELDSRNIVSFGDSHSPAKLGRELTVFKLEKLTYGNIYAAFRSRKKADSANQILYTVEFYPEEGKYHYTGHRNCGIKQAPEETTEKGATCPVCGKLLTLGVMHRVAKLAGRKPIKPLKKTNENGVVGYYNPLDKTRPPYIMLVPLMEILSESFNLGVSSNRVQNEYENLTKNLGSELDVLTQIKLEKIERLVGAKAAEGIKKVRKGEIVVDPGFDGVFGVVKIWGSGEDKKEEISVGVKSEQASLF